jgi:hypothetical protein
MIDKGGRRMSDNVKTVNRGKGTASSAPSADEWLKYFSAGYRVGKNLKDGSGKGVHPFVPGFDAIKETIQDLAVEAVSLQLDVVGEERIEAVKAGAFEALMEVDRELLNRSAGVPGGFSESHVHTPIKVGSAVSDQNSKSVGSQKVLYLGLPGKQVDRDQEDEEGSSGRTAEKPSSDPVGAFLRSLTHLEEATRRLNREASHPDPCASKRLGAEVNWLDAVRRCTQAYESMERWVEGVDHE